MFPKTPVILAAALTLAACNTPTSAPTLQLPLFGDGYRAAGDQCRSVGEDAYTNQFLDDAADLVACPEGYEGIGVFQHETNAVELEAYAGHVLFSVPRR
ncbi:MAG: hypothetical protein ACU0CA_17105 [Paracoccaceae bacterium]